MITRIYNCNSEFINSYGLVTHIVVTFGDKIVYMRLYDTGDEILWEFDKEKLVSVQTYYTKGCTYVQLADGDNSYELAFEEQDMADLFVHYCEGLIERNAKQ